MNKTRRRLGRARRSRARLIHEIRNWTRTNYTAPPRRGRLRVPVLALMAMTGLMFRRGGEQLEHAMAPVLEFMSQHARSQAALLPISDAPPDQGTK